MWLSANPGGCHHDPHLILSATARPDLGAHLRHDVAIYRPDYAGIGDAMIRVIFMNIIGLVIANFLFQAITDKNWAKATEISYFQSFALAWIAFQVWWGMP